MSCSFGANPGEGVGGWRSWLGALGGLAVLVTGAGWLPAAAIPLPNASFEAPATDFVDIRINSWQETPKPPWYVETPERLWDQVTGVFTNTAPGSPDHIDNLDGGQAIFLFALPQVGLFQDYNSVDWSSSVPTHAFDARFELGAAYRLTVGVIGGTLSMASGVSLEISLYYRDDASNMVTVAATNIINSDDLFPTNTHLVDFQVTVPPVSTNDPWAGRHIGVQLLSTATFANMGGYWDLDHVRLEAISDPVLLEPGWVSGQFQCTVQSAPGLNFEMFATTNLALPMSQWTSLGTLSNPTGRTLFTDPATNLPRRFYQARQLP
jgi:hypothetical protein